ncbi:hypothetical protein CDIK_1726 [Cucumispora dikerogammari]|nr:hypothetical protein CDIK_1726 [Cucumispora dikerogammari]
MIKIKKTSFNNSKNNISLVDAREIKKYSGIVIIICIIRLLEIIDCWFINKNICDITLLKKIMSYKRLTEINNILSLVKIRVYNNNPKEPDKDSLRFLFFLYGEFKNIYKSRKQQYIDESLIKKPQKI